MQGGLFRLGRVRALWENADGLCAILGQGLAVSGCVNACMRAWVAGVCVCVCVCVGWLYVLVVCVCVKPVPRGGVRAFRALGTYYIVMSLQGLFWATPKGSLGLLTWWLEAGGNRFFAAFGPPPARRR